MAFDREAAKQAGYTDEEIDAFLQANPQARKEEVRQPGPVAPDTEPPAPATVINEPGTSAAAVATTAGLAAAPYVVPAAVGGATALGANKLYNAWNASAKAAQAIADAKMASEQGIAQRAATRAGMPVTGTPSGPVAPQAPMPQAAPATAPTAQQPSAIQRGMDYANRVRQAAANRITGFGAGGMAVPGAVAAGGAAATGIAGGQLAAMTPEQRKAYYDNMMLGAMGGDAALGAAIMNRGQ